MNLREHASMKFSTIKNPLSDKLYSLDSQVQKSDEPLPKDCGHLIWSVIGKKGTGKSTLMLNALKIHYKKYFDNVYLISTTAEKDDKFSDLIEELAHDGKYFSDCTVEIVQEILDKLEAYNGGVPGKHKKKVRNLVIFDDCLHLLPKQTKGGINQLFTCNRHFKTSVWVTSQKWNALNTLIRSNCDLHSFFRTDSKQEYETIKNDMNINPDLFDSIYNYVFEQNDNDNCITGPSDNERPFLHISFCGGKPAFYRKFDRITRTST